MSDMRQMTTDGRRIEEGSFDIVDREAGDHGFPADQWEVVRRVIHATADFDFIQRMRFHPEAVEHGVQALRAGAPILVDVAMIEAGLSRPRLAHYGCEVRSHISDEDVIARAKEQGGTRAAEAMRKARREGLLDGAIVAIGNAPTALTELVHLVREQDAKPALIIGVPVGFVSAAEAKDAVLEQPRPYIVSQGRKGGSPIAVSTIHALLRLSTEGVREGSG